jgi:hypothetical protein
MNRWRGRREWCRGQERGRVDHYSTRVCLVCIVSPIEPTRHTLTLVLPYHRHGTLFPVLSTLLLYPYPTTHTRLFSLPGAPVYTHQQIEAFQAPGADIIALASGGASFGVRVGGLLGMNRWGGRREWCSGQERKENVKHSNMSQHDRERREV